MLPAKSDNYLIGKGPMRITFELALF